MFLIQALKKTVFGQVTIFPVYVSAFYTYMGLLEGRSLSESVRRMGERFIPTMITGAVFWPCVNVVNFMVVPSHQRVAYVGLAGLIWNAYLSWQTSTDR
jgi:protein Mpv17